MSLGRARHQKPGEPGRSGMGRGEAEPEPGSDEARLARQTKLEAQGGQTCWRRRSRESNMAAAWKRVKANAGSAGVDGLTVQSNCRVPQDRLAPDPGGTAHGQLPAAAGAPGADSEGRGRDARTGDSDRDGPADSASPAASPAAVDRSDVLRAQLRLPAGPTRARRGAASAASCASGLPDRGGRGSGEVLRSGQSRRADGPAGQADRGQGRAAADPPLPGSRDHGQRRGHGAVRGNAARRAAARRCWPTCCWTKWIGSWSERGHRFVRYADDCNVYVRSQKAGERVLEGLRELLRPTPPEGQRAKTAVGRAYGRKFLGYCLWQSRGRGQAGGRRIRRWTPSSGASGKSHVGRAGAACPRSLNNCVGYLPGWKAYFRLAQTPRVFRETGRMAASPPARLAAQALAARHDDVPGADARWARARSRQRASPATPGAGGVTAATS